jgi:hypothetical protein
MEQLTQWATTKPKLDLSNYNYKFLLSAQIEDDWITNYLNDIPDNCVAPGRLVFLMICDNKIPMASWLYNGAMPGDDDDIAHFEKDHWNAPPIPNTVWKKPFKCHYRSGILTLPTVGHLFVPITFSHYTIFSHNIDSHMGLLIFDAETRSIEFFEPNGPKDYRHKHWVAAVEKFTTEFAPDWSFRDVGSMCQPHTWYKYKHGVCSLWVLVYAMLRIAEVSPAQIGLFLLELGPEKAANLISNLFLHLMEKYLPTEDYHRALRDYTIPERYQRLLPADYQIQ